MTQRSQHCRPAGVHRCLWVINDGAHPLTFYGVGKPVFVELPTIFVILQPREAAR